MPFLDKGLTKIRKIYKKLCSRQVENRNYTATIIA